MNRRFFMALALFSLVMLPLADAKASAEEEAKAQQMVDTTIAYFKEHGAEATIAAVNAGANFKDGEIYVFMITVDGMSVANAADQTNVGMNATHLKDSTGNPYVREILDSATEEGAWVHYTDQSGDGKRSAQDELGAQGRGLCDRLRRLYERINDRAIRCFPAGRQSRSAPSARALPRYRPAAWPRRLS